MWGGLHQSAICREFSGDQISFAHSRIVPQAQNGARP